MSFQCQVGRTRSPGWNTCVTINLLSGASITDNFDCGSKGTHPFRWHDSHLLVVLRVCERQFHRLLYLLNTEMEKQFNWTNQISLWATSTRRSIMGSLPVFDRPVLQCQHNSQWEPFPISSLQPLDPCRRIEHQPLHAPVMLSQLVSNRLNRICIGGHHPSIFFKQDIYCRVARNTLQKLRRYLFDGPDFFKECSSRSCVF